MVGQPSPLILSQPPSAARDGQGKKCDSEGGDKQGHQKKQKKNKSKGNIDRIPDGLITEFNSEDLQTLKRNPFACFPKIASLGKALLQ